MPLDQRSPAELELGSRAVRICACALRPDGAVRVGGAGRVRSVAQRPRSPGTTSGACLRAQGRLIGIRKEEGVLGAHLRGQSKA